MLLGAAAQANAGSITYQVSDISSGSIGGTAFSNALVTITFVGNTSNVTSRPEIFQNTVGTGSVTISGIGTFSITEPLAVFENVGLNLAGIFDVGSESVILGQNNGAFGGPYHLKTTIGPLTNNAISQLPSLSTTDGTFILSEVGPESTFSSTTAATTTPEPSSLLLFATSLLCVAPFRRKLFGS